MSMDVMPPAPVTTSIQSEEDSSKVAPMPSPCPSLSPTRGGGTVAARKLRDSSLLAEDIASPSPSPVPSVEDMELYRRRKDDMLQASRKHGSMYFVPRRLASSSSGSDSTCIPPCGLINQGATCYLNSLLQTLFMLPELREALYGWRYDPSLHGDDASKCIPYQLQVLFARLQLSHQSAVSTKDLTASFGWSGADAFTQHDIQELTVQLMDALEKSDGQRFRKINRMWRGRSVQYLMPANALVLQELPEEVRAKHPQPSASFCSRRTEEFMDIQVPVAGFKSLGEALKSLVVPERLDGDNRWFCEEIGVKIDALKGTAFESLPDVLSLHLMRFQFDYRMMRRVKVMDALAFPRSIDLSFLLRNNPATESSNDSTKGGALKRDTTVEAESQGQTEALWYDLYSILIHQGSADRGHYYAYIRSEPKAQSRNLIPSAREQKGLGNGGDSAESWNDAESRSEHAESRGTDASGRVESDWFCFNDSNVYRIEAKEEAAIFTGQAAIDSTDSATSACEKVHESDGALQPRVTEEQGEEKKVGGEQDDAPNAPASSDASEVMNSELVQAAAHTSSSNAYMLFYRKRRNVATEKQNVHNDKNMSTATVMPERLRAEVEAETREWEELRRCHSIHRQMVELVVYSPFSSSVTPEPPQFSSAAGAADSDSQRDSGDDPRNSLDRSKKEDKKGYVVLHFHESTTYQEALMVARDALIEDETDSTIASSSSLATFPVGCCRLRRFNPHLHRAGETFGKAITAAANAAADMLEKTCKESMPCPLVPFSPSLKSLGLHSHATLLLEIRDPSLFVSFHPTAGQPCPPKQFVPWEEYNPREMSLRIVRWDSQTKGPMKAFEEVVSGEGEGSPGESKTARMGSSCVRFNFSVTVPGEEQATVASGRVAVAAALGLLDGLLPSLTRAKEALSTVAVEAATLTTAAIETKAAPLTLSPADAAVAAQALMDHENEMAVAAQLSRDSSIPEKAVVSTSPSTSSSTLVRVLRRVVLVKVANSTDALLLDSDSKALRRGYDVWPGESLFLELADEGATNYTSDVIATYESAVNTIGIQFNHPDFPEEVGTLSIPIKRSASLATLKQAAIELLNNSSEDTATYPSSTSSSLDAQEIHCRRGNSKGGMLKDEGKTLKALGFVDGSIIWLGHGKTCKPSECMVTFLRYDPGAKPPFAPLMTLPVSGNAKVSSVKAALAKWLNTHAPPRSDLETQTEGVAIVDPLCVRLRDKKVSSVGSILRDSRSMRSALTTFTDGREVAVQFLGAPETVGADDLVVNVKGFRSTSKKFTAPVEVVLPKSLTTAEMRVRLTERFGSKLLLPAPADLPKEEEENSQIRSSSSSSSSDTNGSESTKNRKIECSRDGTSESTLMEGNDSDDDGYEDYLEIAKGMPGPPIKAATAAKNLKWEDPRWANEHAEEIGRPPLQLRDGSLLFIRSHRDAVKAAKIAGEASSKDERGGGLLSKSTIARAKTRSWAGSWAASGNMSHGRAREATLNIAVSHESAGGTASTKDLQPAPGVPIASTDANDSSGTITVEREGCDSATPITVRQKVAIELRVPYEAVSNAFDFSGGDEKLARELLRSEFG